MVCIGVAEDEISESEDYICWQCRGNNRPKASASNPPSLHTSPVKFSPTAPAGRAYSPPSSSHSTAAMALAMMSQGAVTGLTTPALETESAVTEPVATESMVTESMTTESAIAENSGQATNVGDLVEEGSEQDSQMGQDGEREGSEVN